MSLWRFLKRRRRDEDLDEEIRGHLRMAARDREELGEHPKEAELSARRDFGNVELVKETVRDIAGSVSLDSILRSIRYAMRGMTKSPGFSTAAVLTLAVGFAAATVVFSVINAVLLRPLPFQQSDRIVTISEIIPFFGQKPQVVALRNYVRWRESGVFALSAALGTTDASLIGAGQAERVSGAMVTTDFFRIFGIHPALGRDFLAADQKPGAAVAILSHELWARKFQFDPNIVGKPIHLGDSLVTVVGVAPRGFDFPRQADLGSLMSWAPERTEYWVPFPFTEKDIQNGNFQLSGAGPARGWSYAEPGAKRPARYHAPDQRRTRDPIRV